MDEIKGWEDFINSFLKASDVLSDTQIFVVTSVKEVMNKDMKTIRLILENNKTEYWLDLNKTNGMFLKNSGIKHPKDILGKKLYFRKVMVQNPQTKKEVEGLRISRVE